MIVDMAIAGLVVLLVGGCLVLFAEPLHKIAPYWHGDSAVGVRILGWLVVGFGGLLSGLAVLIPLIRG